MVSADALQAGDGTSRADDLTEPIPSSVFVQLLKTVADASGARAQSTGASEGGGASARSSRTASPSDRHDSAFADASAEGTSPVLVSEAAEPGEACSAQHEETVRRLIASGRCKDANDMIESLQGCFTATCADLLRGEVFLEQSRLSEASACFMAILREEPKNERALRAVAELHRRNEDLESCYAVRARSRSAPPIF
jgi:hypothetical protein